MSSLLFRCTERFDNFENSKAACLFQMYISGSELWVIPEAFLIEYHYNRHSYLLKPAESKWEVRIKSMVVPFNGLVIHYSLFYRKQLKIECILNSFEKHVFIMQKY